MTAAAVSEEHSDPFTAVLGAGRGLSAGARSRREADRAQRTRPQAFVVTDRNGTVTVSYYRHNDPQSAVLHRGGFDGPALLKTDALGNHLEHWYKDGQLHSYMGHPAKVETYADGRHLQAWYHQGVKHRVGGPAHVETKIDGSSSIEYYYEGENNRVDGPAVITTGVDGTLLEEWFIHGQRHRDGGPAWTEANADGRHTERYYVDNQMHREDGPSRIETADDGSVIAVEYHVRGRACTGPTSTAAN